MNLNKLHLSSGFTLIELMTTTLLASMLWIGFAMLGNGVWDQLSYEDINQKVQDYGNYVLDDVLASFKKYDVEDIQIDHTLEHDIIRVKIDNAPDIKYHIQEVANPFHTKSNNVVYKNDELIHRNNGHIETYYNEFDDKGYAVAISEFACNKLEYKDKYGTNSAPLGGLGDVVYVVDLQIKIYKERSNGNLEIYNTVDFQKTIFISDVHKI